MPKITAYKVVAALNNVDKFVAEVTDEIAHGWQPLGMALLHGF